MPSSEAGRKDLIKELEDFRDEFGKYKELVLKVKNRRQLTVTEAEEFEWLRSELPQQYGGLKEVIEKCAGPAVLPLQGGRVEYEVFTSSFNYTPFAPNSLSALLDKAITTVNIAIGKLKSSTSNRDEADDSGAKQLPKAFISHGKESKALDKLCRFVSGLGISPLVVKDQPSKAKALDDKVEYYMNEADCAIILATGDDEIKGKLYPRQNVIHEIGLAQKTFPEKIIYLLEEGAEFPANIKPKVWERFSQDCMDEAFIAVARELRALGLIKATKECK